MTSNPFNVDSTAKASDVLHQTDDVDEDAHSHHHTLGSGPFQAAPGNHHHGTRVTKFTLAVDFASIPANSTIDLNVTKTGIAVGDFVALMPESVPEVNIVLTVVGTTVDTIILRAANLTAAAIDPASRNYTFIVVEAL